MNAVYDCLEDGKVGIFESPTGTGKSLSLICGSLTWLRDHKRRTFEEGFTVETAESDDPPWMLERARQKSKQAALRRRQDLEDRIAKVKAKEKRINDRYQNREPLYKRQKLTPNDSNGNDGDEARFILADYESDDETSTKPKATSFNEYGLSAETEALMQQLGYSLGPKKEQPEEAVDELKIFFSSRTHSQLTQFSSELIRVKMPPAITPDSSQSNAEGQDLVEDVKHLTLGSRKNLCINPNVKKLGNATAINERCLELQQAGSSSDSKCAFMPTKEKEALVTNFRDHALAEIRDIEDLGLLGKKLGVCPYYSSRPATKYCEVRDRYKLKNVLLIIFYRSSHCHTLYFFKSLLVMR